MVPQGQQLNSTLFFFFFLEIWNIQESEQY